MNINRTVGHQLDPHGCRLPDGKILALYQDKIGNFSSLTPKANSVGYWTLVDIRDPDDPIVVASNQISDSTGARQTHFRAICSPTHADWPNGLIVISWEQTARLRRRVKKDIWAAMFDKDMNTIKSDFLVSDPNLGKHDNYNQHMSFSANQDFVIFAWESSSESHDGGVTWQNELDFYF